MLVISRLPDILEEIRAAPVELFLDSSILVETLMRDIECSVW